ncbi:MAG: NAD(P)-dependent glycerol-1-phosphate dehydrogenase [Candidatus Asgardarchaeia archaeon]
MSTDFMEIPRYVVMGSKISERIGEVFKKLKLGSKGIVISGMGNTKKIALDKFIPILSEYRKVEHYEVGYEDSMVEEINRIYSLIKEKDYKFIVSVGGGRVIDVGKVAATWSNTPFLSFPTSASHDGIASPSISFLLRLEIKEKLGKKIDKVSAPIAIVADTSVISNAPRRLLNAGFGDLISKTTAVKDWQLAHRLRLEDYSEYAAAMAIMSSKIALENVNVIKRGGELAARVLTKALIGCGVSMSIAGSSRPASGAEHLFSHAIDYLSKKYGFEHALHGEQCGVGTIVAMYLHGGDWVMIKDALKEVGAPTNAKELRIDEEYLIEALSIAHSLRPERYTILGDKGISREAAEAALKKTGVI